MRGLCLFAVVSVSLTLALLPFMVNGAPFLQDAWDHMHLALAYARTGRIVLKPGGELSSRWFLVNMLIYLLFELAGVPLLQASQVAPFLGGLSILPFYLALVRLTGHRRLAALCSLALSLESLHITLVASVAKVTTSFYPLMCSLLLLHVLVTEPSARTFSTLALCSLGVLLGHHYMSLSFSVLLLTTALYMLMGWLRGEVSEASALGASAISILFPSCFYAYVRLVGASTAMVSLDDLLLLTSCGILFSVVLLRRGRPLLWPLILVAPVVAFLILRGQVYAMYFLATDVRPHEIAGYGLLTLCFVACGGLVGSSGAGEKLARAYMAAAATMAFFSFLYGFFYVGIMLLLKASYFLGPAAFAWLALAISNSRGRTRHVLLGLLATSMLLIPLPSLRCTVLGDPGLGGLSSYRRGQYEELRALAPFISGGHVYGDTTVSYVSMMLEDVDVWALHPHVGLKDGSRVVVFKRSWEAGLLEAGYEWFDLRLVVRGRHDRVFDGGHTLVLVVVGDWGRP